MPKSSFQKLKPLYIADYLMHESDEHHPVSVKNIIDHLEALGIAAERKSIYSDIEALTHFGLDVISVPGSRAGYYIGSRDFELPELKLLVDTVQSSKFITEKKTTQLISKIERLASIHDAGTLQRQVRVRNRVKSMNESVYYNVDEISAAISDDMAIRFRYFSYNVKKEAVFHRDGEFYDISPFTLICEDENYYMVGWDDEEGRFKHFRVDKMKDIGRADHSRRGSDRFSDDDIAVYTKKVFGMFLGEEKTVTLRFKDTLAGAVIDRFGKDIIITPGSDGTFTVSPDVVISPQFYGWLFGFGDMVEVLSPAEVRSEMRELCLKSAEKHR